MLDPIPPIPVVKQFPFSVPLNFNLSLHFFFFFNHRYFHPGSLISRDDRCKRIFLRRKADHVAIWPDSSAAPFRPQDTISTPSLSCMGLAPDSLCLPVPSLHALAALNVPSARANLEPRTG